MYEREYEAMYQLESSYWWYVARRRLAVDLLVDEIRCDSNVHILDVGCGTGANVQALARLGPTVGIDASADALQFCRRRGIGSVAHSLVEQLPFTDKFFRVVTALDILEHTDDDLHALREIRRVCRTDGLVLITVPAYGFLWSEHDEALKHRRRYGANELRNKLKLTGFEVVRTSYFVSALFFPIFVLRVWQSIQKDSTRPKTSLVVLPNWLNSFLIGLLRMEQHLFHRMNLPFGVSIVALARPKE
jgi:ubiquinone/menaquinone biosynthesis C-methylase UbiE